MNKKIFKYYDKLAQNPHPLITRNKSKDFTKYDVEFLKQFASKDKILLDIGSGTGLTINQLVNDFKKIIAIEKYKEFSQFIDKKIEVINTNILDFDFNLEFDIATAFGIVQYFSLEEITNIYKKIFKNVKEYFIIKGQFGIYEDVIVDGISDELRAYYFSYYRHLDKEINLLKQIGFYIEKVVDIYPKEYNRWDNTHFYAIVCKKSERFR